MQRQLLLLVKVLKFDELHDVQDVAVLSVQLKHPILHDMHVLFA